MSPREAIIAVTYRCNAECAMCNIWKKSPTEECTPEAYAKLPHSLRTVNITGGEPFLRSDLPAIIEVMNHQCDKPRIVISTNGLLPTIIEKQVRDIMGYGTNVGLRISVDGIGENHDKIRGVRDAFKNVLKSISALQHLGIRDLGIAFTVMEANLDDIKSVYDLSCKLDIEFAINLAYKSKLYFDNENSDVQIDILNFERALEYIKRSELLSWRPKRWFRSYYEDKIVGYALRRRRLSICTAAREFFFMDPLANIYPCTILNKKIGNLCVKDFAAIWNSETSRQIQNYVRQCPYNCWMTCNAASLMRKQLRKSMLWILVNKVRSHAGVCRF